MATVGGHTSPSSIKSLRTHLALGGRVPGAGGGRDLVLAVSPPARGSLVHRDSAAFSVPLCSTLEVFSSQAVSVISRIHKNKKPEA